MFRLYTEKELQNEIDKRLSENYYRDWQEKCMSELEKRVYELERRIGTLEVHGTPTGLTAPEGRDNA